MCMWQLRKAAREIIAKLCENLNEKITRKLRRKLQICQYYSHKEKRQRQTNINLQQLLSRIYV